MSPSEPTPEPTPEPKARRRRRFARRALLILLAVVALAAAGLIATGRYGVLTPQARLLIEARTDGLKIGRFGRLKVEGLSGDIWRDLRIRRLTVRDEKGVWLDANNVHLVWNYRRLLRRQFDADLLEIERLQLVRRPTLGPKGVDRGLPLSFHIDEARVRVEMLEGFSGRRGVYDVRAELDVARRGGQSGRLHAASVLHPGDHLDVDFRLGGGGPLRLIAEAQEARGGALAGAIGLPTDQPFELDLRAGGREGRGRFGAVARSGALIPLRAQGAWSPEGGQAGGRLLLTASSLTAPYAQRFGEEVVFGIGGRATQGGLHETAVRLFADNLTVRAAGPVALRDRRLGPRGLALEAQTPSLSRITGGPQSRAARVQGVLLGTLQAWRFEGGSAVETVEVGGGYRLARISGPVTLRSDKSGFAVETKLAGAGGQGAGYVAAVLGGAPTLALDAARLPDGRLLLRRLDMRGRGLQVQASGGRSLLGGLNVKGRADVTNLTAARLGASGRLGIAFDAAQSRNQPWRFDLDARGERFASGFAELDRLLGPRPRLQADAAWSQGQLAVSRAVLNGAALDATASGVLRRDRTLAVKVDWGANGPFRAGPVEVSGRATGVGAITGSIGSPRLDLVANLQEVDLPRLPLRNARVTLSFLRQPGGSSGAIAVAAQSGFGPAEGRSDFRFPRGGVDLSNLAVNAGGLKASGAVSLRRSTPSAADLTVDVTRGAFLEAGRLAGTVRIVDGPGGARANLALTAQNARLPGSPVTIRIGQLRADGPLQRLPYTVAAQGASPRGPWTVNGQGQLATLEPGYSLAFDGAARLGERDLRTVETAVFRFGGPERSARLRLAGADGARLNLDGLLKGETADIRASLANLSLTLFNPDLAGRVDAELSAQGRGGRLDGVFDARLADARARGAPANLGVDSTLRGRLADSALTLEAVASNEQGLRANANVVLPTESSASPFRIAIARQRPMRGRFFAEGEVRTLWELLVGGERALAGQVRTEGTLGGTLADPSAVGQFALDRGRFDDGASGLSLRDLTVRAAFAQNAINVSQASGVDGEGGRLTGSGRISLLRNGASSFRLNLDGFQLIDNELATAAASGQATIDRTADGKVRLSGDLTIDRADVAADPPVPTGVVAMDVVEVNRPPELPAPFIEQRRGNGGGVSLDVNLRAPRRVFLRGRGLDVEFSLDAHVGGTTSQPDLSGAARVVRGDYEFAGKRFEFNDRGVVYLSTRPPNIRLQLDAVRDDPSLRVTVRIRGTAARPEINFASNPSLPNDEILSQVLFGRSASQLSPLEAAQLASAVSSLAGGGGLDVIGNLRSFAGLDRLALGGGDASGVTVSGGKYLTEDVYLEITGGGREGPSAQIEWRVRRNLSVLSRITGQGDNRLAVRWRRDY